MPEEEEASGTTWNNGQETSFAQNAAQRPSSSTLKKSGCHGMYTECAAIATLTATKSIVNVCISIGIDHVFHIQKWEAIPFCRNP